MDLPAIEAGLRPSLRQQKATHSRKSVLPPLTSLLIGTLIKAQIKSSTCLRLRNPAVGNHFRLKWSGGMRL